MTGALRDRVVRGLDEALAHLRHAHEATDVRDDLDAARARMRARLQVAVVGRVSSGKSTLVNALIGERLAPTGVQELTFNVNHFRRGPGRSVTARFADGEVITLPSRVALEQYAAVEQYTARGEDNRERLRGVEHVEVMSDNPYLELFDLVDTPGLDSVFGEEARKTLGRIGLGGNEVRDASHRAAEVADALVVVLDNRLASAVDEQLLVDFRGPGTQGRTPVTTLGVLTKVEHLWDPDEVPEPLVLARRNAARLVRAGSIGSLLFEIVPVCSLVGQFAVTLDGDDLADLAALADGVDPADLADLLTDGPVFAAATTLPLTADRRAALYRDLSGYGIHLACREIRAGVRDVDGLRARLVSLSGLDLLRKRLVDHFGHRADLIRLSKLRDDVRPLPWSRAPQLPPREKGALLAAVGVIEQVERGEHGIRELAVLQRLLTRGLDPPDEVRMAMLRALGEYGRSVAERLDLPADGRPDLAALERRAVEGHDTWRFRPPVADRAVQQIMIDTYAGLRDAVRDARIRLERPW